MNKWVGELKLHFSINDQLILVDICTNLIIAGLICYIMLNIELNLMYSLLFHFSL